jgi:Uma2 family endonuclease
MATIERPARTPELDSEWLDEDGFPWLENGERMNQEEFLERYQHLPAGVKAELIGGIVYIMASPLRLRHARSDFEMIGWLYVYSAATPGTQGQCNATTILGDEATPQPDSALVILPGHGGQSRDGDDDYTHGAPELVIEVAWSSRALDLHAKLHDYERAGVREYLVRDLRAQAIHWFELRDARLEPLVPDADGLYRSRIFPGLWLDPAALAAGDKAAMLAALNRGLASPEHAAFVAELERRRLERAPRP